MALEGNLLHETVQQIPPAESRKVFRAFAPGLFGNGTAISSWFALVTAPQTSEGHAPSSTFVVMTPILLLFILGIVLLFLDLFVPGIILSAAGTVAFLGATYQAFQDYGMSGGLEAFAVGAVLLTSAMWFEYGYLPKTKFGQKFFLHAAVRGASQPVSDAVALTGRECVAVTPLAPSGQVEIDGKRYEALSIDGHIDRGARLKVAGTQSFSLTVTKFL
jgi:membrane-bound ClpP family serine protease